MNFSGPSSGGQSAPPCWRRLFLAGAVAYGFLPVASMPKRRIPDHPRLRKLPRRRSRHHGGDGRRAARAAARRDFRRHRDDLAQLARLDANHRAIRSRAATSTAPRATCRRRSTPRCGDLPGDLPTLPAFRKVNPAAAPIMILALTSKTMLPSAIYDVADSVVAQRLGPGRWRLPKSPSAAPSSRRCACGSIRRACLDGRAWRTCAPRSPTPTRWRRSGLSTAGSRDRDRHQRPAPAVARLQNSVVVDQRHGDPARRHRQHRAGRPQQPISRLVQPEPSVLLVITKQATPMSSRRSTASAGCCRSSSVDSGRCRISVLSDRTRPSAPACTTCSSRWSPPSCW